MGFSSAFLIREAPSSFISNSEGRIILEIFLSGISSSKIPLPNASGIVFTFVVMIIPMS